MDEANVQSHRPVSRRGLRADLTSSGGAVPSTASRPVTGSIRGFGVTRPPSTTPMGTATRLTTATASLSSHRIGTALGYAGSMMADRPITQHGLSGLPTSQTRLGTAGGMRMVKDKRYWQAVLQAKINEITQETSKLIKEKQTMDRERSAKRIYDQKVKEAAKELTDLQSQLTDMNITLDSFSSGLTRQHLQKEATALREKNEVTQNQLENLFSERQIKDERNKQLEQEIEIEKNKINDMILSLPLDEQGKYRELQSLAEDLKMQSVEIHNQIDTLTGQKERLNAIVMSSQMRLEAARLKLKLKELTEKHNVLVEEEENKLTPEQERDKLIKDVRMNNQSLISIGHQMKIVEDQLSEKKDLLQLVEQDLEEGNSERHAKYKELKRRDETMTVFLETFPQHVGIERKNLELLKNHIAYAIEQITLQGINMRSWGSQGPDTLTEKNDLNSQDGLLKEYKKLSIQLKQLQILEKRTAAQLKQLTEEEAELLSEIPKYSNLNALRAEAAENMSELTTKLDELRKKNRVTEDVVSEAKERNQEIKEHLRSNETYRQISHLEERLTDLMRENKTLQEVVEEERKTNDYSVTRKNVQDLVNSVNRMLLGENGKNKKL